VQNGAASAHSGGAPREGDDDEGGRADALLGEAGREEPLLGRGLADGDEAPVLEAEGGGREAPALEDVVFERAGKRLPVVEFAGVSPLHRLQEGPRLRRQGLPVLVG